MRSWRSRRYASWLGWALLIGCRPHPGESATESAPADESDTPPVETDLPPIGRFDEVIECPNAQGHQRAVIEGTDLVEVPIIGPNSLCNDGSRAIMYVDAVPGSPDWAIVFEGGGSCREYDKCVDRWCTTWFRMGTSRMPAGIEGHGILSPREDNRFAGYNRVFAYYCSSDMWVGDRDDAVMSDPTGVGEPFTISFHGRDIEQSMLRQLGAGVSYVDPVTQATVDLPPLGAARQVLVAGSSAGSNGMRFNLDDIAKDLPGVDVRGVFDGSVNVEESEYLSEADYEALVHDDYDVDFGAPHFDATYDASCRAAHPDDRWQCADLAHALLNHVTTPMFVHEDLRVLAHDYVGDPLIYSRLLWRQLDGLENLRTTAEDGAAMTRTPGLFLAACTDHTSIQWDQFSGDRVTVGDESLSFDDVLWNWTHDGSPTIVREPEPIDQLPHSATCTLE
jgi:hypothetical protein